MLAQNGCNLVFQPPYHPVFNTCEYCFRVMKGWLRKNTELTENHTVVGTLHLLCFKKNYEISSEFSNLLDYFTFILKVMAVLWLNIKC